MSKTSKDILNNSSSSNWNKFHEWKDEKSTNDRADKPVKSGSRAVPLMTL